MRHAHILTPRTALLIVVDMQEPFLRAMHGREPLTANVRLLVQAAGILRVPVLTTTQNAARMGGFVPDIVDVLPENTPDALDKMTFSCAGIPAFVDAVQASGRSQILLCGVETHICVSQTALDLTALGFQVHVAVDAMSSRTVEKHKLGMERLRDSGVMPCAAEAAVYELLTEAGTPAFRQILALVK